MKLGKNHKTGYSNERGDTLIEVAIATIIIGIILLSAYVLANRSFQLGQSAKERSQAAQLLQEQAEGLRSLRDRAASWTSFRSQLTPMVGEFHMERVSNRWQPSRGSFNPGDAAFDPANAVADFYTVVINGDFTGTGDDKLEASVTITWPRLGGDPMETSTLYLKLTDRNLTL